MTKQCAACNKFMQAKNGAVCKTCTSIYHKGCLLMPETARVASDWMCPECKNKEPKGDNSATPVKGASSSYSDSRSGKLADAGLKSVCDLSTDLQQQLQFMTSSLREIIQSEIRTAREEMVSELRRELADVRAALAASHQRVDSLEKRLEALETIPKPADDQSTDGQLNNITKQLKLELNDRDQELLSSDLEIANFPETNGERVIHTVGLIASKLGVTLEPRDIVYAERVGPRGGAANAAATAVPSSRRIVVRLARRGLRNDLLLAARARRGLTSADMGLEIPVRRFFVNERLTRHNKQIFYRVRELGLRLGWRYIWSKRGRILVKQADRKPTFNIRSEADFERVFGKDDVSTNRN